MRKGEQLSSFKRMTAWLDNRQQINKETKLFKPKKKLVYVVLKKKMKLGERKKRRRPD